MPRIEGNAARTTNTNRSRAQSTTSSRTENKAPERSSSGVRTRETKDPAAYRRNDKTRSEARTRWRNREDVRQRQAAADAALEERTPKGLMTLDPGALAKRMGGPNASETQTTSAPNGGENGAPNATRDGRTVNTGNPRLDIYLSQPPADTSQVPETLAGFEYGSIPPGENAQNLILESDKEFIAAYVPTPPEAGQLREAGIANAFNPEWQSQIADAVERNGGLGNSEDGFLAWSKDGFVRFRNPMLTPEQNRRMAEISLTMGNEVERMPSRWSIQTEDRVKDREAAQRFIQQYDDKFAEFKADPSKGLTLRDSKRRFVLKMDEESGRAVSYYYKKKGGFSGFVQKNLKVLQPVIGIASVALAPFTGGASLAVGALAGAGLTVAATGKLDATTAINAVGGAFAPFTAGLSTVAAAGINAVRAGSVKAKELFSAAAAYFTGGNSGLSASASAAINTGANVAGGLIDDGKISAVDIASGLTQAVGGFTGDPTTDAFINGAIRSGASAIDRGELNASDIATAVSPLLAQVDVDPTTRGLLNGGLDAVADAIDRGELRAADFATAINGTLGNTPRDRRIKRALKLAARSVDSGRISATQIAAFVIPLLKSDEEAKK